MAINWSEKQAALIMAPYNHTLDWLEGTPRSGKTTAGIMRFSRHLIRSRDNIHLVTAYSFRRSVPDVARRQRRAFAYTSSRR